MTLDDVVSFDVLEAATHRLCDAVGYEPVIVRRLPRPMQSGNHGDAWPKQRTVRYADTAPLSTVCHEVAHLLCPSSHGEVWQAQYRSLLVLFASLET